MMLTKELLDSIEFRSGTWSNLKSDYFRYHGKKLDMRPMLNHRLDDNKRDGSKFVWVNYRGKTVYAQSMKVWEDHARQGEYMFRLVYNALMKMRASYGFRELDVFVKDSGVLRVYLDELWIEK